MKILAIEMEVEGINSEQFVPHLQAEARRVWELYQSGVLREIFFRTDRSQAVLILECADANEAGHVLESFPLVQAGLIRFDVMPLLPYPGFARLFKE